MAFESIGAVSELLRSLADRIRAGIISTTSVKEQRINAVMEEAAEILEKMDEIVRKARCAAERRGESSSPARACGHWMIIEGDGRVAVYRVKPHAVISYDGRRIVFKKDHVMLETDGLRMKMCKWEYCKEFNPTDRREVGAILPQLIYLARNVNWHVSKALEGLDQCIKYDATVAACMREY